MTQRRSGVSQHMTKKWIYAYISNISTDFNVVPMAQWITPLPCNRKAEGSNLNGNFGFFLKGAHYAVDDSGKKLN